jgi:3-deoxy-7-phosphoheptulonate synthase
LLAINEMSTNTRVQVNVLPTPSVLKRQHPLTKDMIRDISTWRQTIVDILHGKDSRLLMIVGPCSVHDPIAVVDYARRLSILQEKCPKIFFVMRTYFEKPRTRKGWSGFMHDPHLNGSNDMVSGVIACRKLLLQLTTLRVPTATETLSLVAPQYIDDLISFACIGARTTESQPHRELASGLSVPVGFKNSTNGDISVAINSIVSASEGKVFMGINANGRVAAINTVGNPHCCLVLRGGVEPNYREELSEQISTVLQRENISTGIVIDASHGNSGKKWKRQIDVLKYLAVQRHRNVRGIMMESFILDGSQSLNSSPLTYGLSVTDECIGWEKTEDVLKHINKHC